MAATFASELILIRHAPAEAGGRLCGRGDAALRPLAPKALEQLQRLLGSVETRLSSPARRCLGTAEALWPEAVVPGDARLWEQDFGDWEDCLAGELPDLGPLSPDELAAHRPPCGESFADMCGRVQPALRELAGASGTAAVIGHAGTVRAGLALAVGLPAALCFEIDPLSVTRLRIAGDTVSVVCANCMPG